MRIVNVFKKLNWHILKNADFCLEIVIVWLVIMYVFHQQKQDLLHRMWSETRSDY